MLLVSHVDMNLTVTPSPIRKALGIPVLSSRHGVGTQQVPCWTVGSSGVTVTSGEQQTLQSGSHPDGAVAAGSQSLGS